MSYADKPIQIGVIGCGAHCVGTHLPNIVADRDFKLRWCCDVDEGRLAHVAERFRPLKSTVRAEDLWDDPELEAVLISTAHDVRVSLVEGAARAGKGIYVEKPLAGSVEEMERIAAIIHEHPVPFVVGHNRRMAPATQAAKALFDAHRSRPVSCAWRFDREGDARPKLPQESQAMVLCRINDDLYSWKLWAFDDGIVICELTHFVDLISFVLGSEPAAVSAIGNKVVNSIASLEFRDGSLGCIFTSGVGSFGYPKELWEFYCHGSVIVNDHFCELRVAGVPGVPFRQTFPLVGEKPPGGGIHQMYVRTWEAQRRAVEASDTSILPLGPDKGHRAILSAFGRHVRGDGPSPADLRSAVVSTLATLKITEALQSGRKETVELPEWVDSIRQ